jgi:hypothetical protein
MSEQGSYLARVSRWFKRRLSSQEDLPLLYGSSQTSEEMPRRSMLGLPWRRREEDLTVLQAGLTSMAALMTSLRQYLDQQSARHDELLNYLSQLSQALQAIPDSSRAQGEMLRVLHQQIAYQNAQHKQLSEMIRKIGESSGSQQDISELLRDRVETLYKNDLQISQTIESMGNSVTLVTQNSQANTMVLERLRDNLVTRDSDLERSIRQQNRWIISGLLVAIALSAFSLIVAMIVLPYNISTISKIAAEVSQSRPAAAGPVDTGNQSLEPTKNPGLGATTHQAVGQPATQAAAATQATVRAPTTQGGEEPR